MKYNTSVYTVLEHLCHDLGWTLRFLKKEMRYEILGELRVELLRLSETEGIDGFNPTALSAFWAKLTSLFHVPFGRDDLSQPECFRDCYQVLSFVLKVKIESSHDHEENYIRNLKGIFACNSTFAFDGKNPVNRLSRFAFRMATGTVDFHRESGGRHGPGAVYDREIGEDKNFFNPPNDQVLARYSEECFFANLGLMCELTGQSARWRECERDRFTTCRLALVPKDYKGPRGVFVSPKEVVFLQLQQGDEMQSAVPKSWLGLCYNPVDQSPSQEVAYMGSYNRGWATLDLKDASDRITTSLVAGLAYRSDYLDLCATRPTYVEFPSGERCKSQMFSPMGDGKTFPVLTYVCASICMGAILHADGIVPSRVKYTDLIDAAKKLRVFGDDIAVHTKYFDAVCCALELNNLKVNVRKSFVFGYFRESCGLDAYKGVVVTPIRLRLDPENIKPEDLVSLCDMYNRMALTKPSWKRTLCLIERLVQSLAKGRIAYTLDPERNPCMLYDREAVMRNLTRKRSLRWSTLHRVEVKTVTWREKRVFPPSLMPWWNINYWLLQKGASEPVVVPTLRRESTTIGSPSARAYLNRYLSRMQEQWAMPKPSGFLSTEYRTIFR